MVQFLLIYFFGNEVSLINYNNMTYEKSKTDLSSKAKKFKPEDIHHKYGFGPEAKTRGGTLGVPGCIHTRTKNIC